MAKDAVLNRIVLGTIGRIVRDTDFQSDPVGQGLQVLLEERRLRGVAATAITQDQQLVRMGIRTAALGFPPMGQAITGKFGGVAARAKIDMGFIAVNIVDAMRNHFALCIAGKIMIEHFDGLLRVELSITIEVAQQLFFLVSMLITGCPMFR